MKVFPRSRRVSLFIVLPAVAFALVAAAPGTASAQDRDMTRLQIADRATCPREVVVASPRASIAWAVPHQPEIGPISAASVAELPTFQVGAAENFAATGISLVVRKDAVVHFRESRQVEGVWYEETHGRLGTVLLVQLKNPTDATPEWITLGRDGAGALRSGPSIGTANVSVRVRFPRLGDFLLRAVVVTGAIPMGVPDDATAAEPVDSPYCDFDIDLVPIKVTVVDTTEPVEPGSQEVPRGPNLGYGEPLLRMFRE